MKRKDIGNIRLSELNHEIATKQGVEGIFIPFNTNPCLFVNKKDEKTVVDLDVEIIETQQSQYGTNKMVKASLPKTYREKNRLSFDSEEYKRLTPILGNLKTYEYATERQNNAQQQQQKPAVKDDFDDLPPGLENEGNWGDPAPDPQGWK